MSWAVDNRTDQVCATFYLAGVARSRVRFVLIYFSVSLVGLKDLSDISEHGVIVGRSGSGTLKKTAAPLQAFVVEQLWNSIARRYTSARRMIEIATLDFALDL